MLQNTSGGTLSGDFPPKTKMFSAENTPKIHRNQYFAILPIENTAAIGSVALWKRKLRDPRCPFLTVPDLCNNISVKFRFMADQQDTSLVFQKGAL